MVMKLTKKAIAPRRFGTMIQRDLAKQSDSAQLAMNRFVRISIL